MTPPSGRTASAQAITPPDYMTNTSPTHVYTFTTVSEGGMRLWVSDTLLIDNWDAHFPGNGHLGDDHALGGGRCLLHQAAICPIREDGSVCAQVLLDRLTELCRRA